MDTPEKQKTEPKIAIRVDPKWDRLIRLAEIMGHGRLEIIIKAGVPTDVDTTLKPHFKLASEKIEEDIENFKAISGD